MKVNALTGGSKTRGRPSVFLTGLPLGDQKSTPVYCGLYGRGRAVVVALGMDTGNGQDCRLSLGRLHWVINFPTHYSC